jgi:hypothetical protein
MTTDAERASEPGESVLDWLLSPEQPAARYRTLRGLLDRPEDDLEVRAARREIPRSGWAQKLLDLQKPEGHWDSPDDLYRPKYSSTIWNFQTLAELGVTRDHPKFARTCELFLRQYARDDGGFDSPPLPGEEGRSSELCVTGNVTRALLLAGYGDDPRVRAGLAWLVRAQLADGGWHCWPQRAFGRGTLDGWEALNAFAAVDAEKRSPEIQESIRRGAEFYLRRGLFRQGRSTYRPWLRFHFPNHYYYDVLVGLNMLTALGYGNDSRLDPALSLLGSKRKPDGKWSIDRAHPDLGAGAGYRLPPSTRPLVVEPAGPPSRWVTGTALGIQRQVVKARASAGGRGSR